LAFGPWYRSARVRRALISGLRAARVHRRIGWRRELLIGWLRPGLHDAHLALDGREVIARCPNHDHRSGLAVIGTGCGTRRQRGDLFFTLNNGDVMTAEITTTTSSVEVGAVKRLFTSPGSPWGVVVSPDGQRFLISVPSEGTSQTAPVSLVINWPAAVRK